MSIVVYKLRDKISKPKMVEYIVKATVLWGHSPKELHPNMKEYILKSDTDQTIIHPGYTLKLLELASNFLKRIVQQKGNILVIGTEFPMSTLIEQHALKAVCHYYNYKWLGGMFTNWKTVLTRMQSLRFLELQEKNGLIDRVGKNEASEAKKELKRLRKYFHGMKYLRTLPDVVIIVDQYKNQNAVIECKKVGVPIISIIDTNHDPDVVDIPIPANDDSWYSIMFILTLLLKPIQSERLKLHPSLKLNPTWEVSFPKSISVNQTQVLDTEQKVAKLGELVSSQTLPTTSYKARLLPPLQARPGTKGGKLSTLKTSKITLFEAKQRVIKLGLSKNQHISQTKPREIVYLKIKKKLKP